MPLGCPIRKSVLRWRNEACKSWKLYPDLSKGLLHTGKANPYYKTNPTSDRSFRLVLKRDASGNYTPAIESFTFQSGHFRGTGP